LRPSETPGRGTLVSGEPDPPGERWRPPGDGSAGTPRALPWLGSPVRPVDANFRPASGRQNEVPRRVRGAGPPRPARRIRGPIRGPGSGGRAARTKVVNGEPPGRALGKERKHPRRGYYAGVLEPSRTGGCRCARGSDRSRRNNGCARAARRDRTMSRWRAGLPGESDLEPRSRALAGPVSRIAWRPVETQLGHESPGAMPGTSHRGRPVPRFGSKAEAVLAGGWEAAPSGRAFLPGEETLPGGPWPDRDRRTRPQRRSETVARQRETVEAWIQGHGVPS